MKSNGTNGGQRSPGKVRDNRAGKNCKPRAGKKAQVRKETARRWPDQATEQKYFELNIDKKQRNRPATRKKQLDLFFPLLESVRPDVLARILLCSSLEVKKVRRYPGWILSRTYNLKNRPIDFS
jgi:hypothetical protein